MSPSSPRRWLTFSSTALRAAREAGRTLLVLDTVTGGGDERRYTRLRWYRLRVIPRLRVVAERRLVRHHLFLEDIDLSPRGIHWRALPRPWNWRA